MEQLEQVIKHCKKGKTKAQNKLYERFAVAMFRLCYRYLENEEEAEEVMVNGFLKVFQNIKDFDYQGENAFVGWIKRIMTNEALMYIRKHKKLYWESIDDQYDLESPEDVLKDLLAEDIYQLIRELPLGYRTVFNLFVIEGLSHKEISEKMGISVNTSKTQLMKAKQLLQKKLKKMP